MPIYSKSRQYIAEYDKSGNRWRISTHTKQAIGSRKLRADAEADLSKLDVGTHKSQSKDRKRQLPAAKRPCRRASSPAVAYAAPTREGNYKAGPGRGNKVEKKRAAPEEKISSTFSPSKAARKLLDSGCENPGKLRAALGTMVNHCEKLKNKLGAAGSKIGWPCAEHTRLCLNYSFDQTI